MEFCNTNNVTSANVIAETTRD